MILHIIIINLNQFSQQNYLKIPKFMWKFPNIPKNSQYSHKFPVKIYCSQNSREFCIPTFHFSKPLRIVLGLPKWEFSNGKNAFHAGKIIQKNDFTPSEKYSSYALVYKCVK